MGKLRISWSFFALVFLILLFDLENVFIFMLPGVLAHELGHAVMLHLSGSGVKCVEVGASGAEMYPASETVGFFASLAEVLGGCAFSFAFALICASLEGAFFSRCAGFSLIFGVFNLLPCRGLDGGRALEIVFDRICGRGAEACMITTAAVAVVMTFAVIRMQGSEELIAAAAGWCIVKSTVLLLRKRGGIMRKTPGDDTNENNDFKSGSTGASEKV